MKKGEKKIGEREAAIIREFNTAIEEHL